MTAPKVGMCLIVRDEADTIERCLASFAYDVDWVAVLDTGSKDDTLGVMWRWFADRGEKVAHLSHDTFEWCDDFAAARRAAEQLLPDDVEWIAWADADDTIHGAEHLRTLAAQAPPELAAYVMGYDYASDEHGNVLCYLRRERLVRRGHGRWEGRVHEAQTIDGQIAQVDPALVEWRHHKAPEQAGASNARNLRLLRQWVKAEPRNPRVLMYLGTEELIRGRVKPAARWLRRYLAETTHWDEERAQVHRKLAICLAAQGDQHGAIQTALQAIAVLPQWPDSYLTLAEAHYALGEPAKAIHHARRVLELGPPSTALIVNPTDYTLAPQAILAGAHHALGDLDTALAHADQVLAADPGHRLARHAHEWRAVRKREETASTFVACADLLCAHDEQAKALQVLWSVPYYATDHPRVVAARSTLRERIDPLMDPAGYRDHYQHGGSKPEDAVEDYLAVGDALPRCGFLLDGLREQAEAVAA